VTRDLLKDLDSQPSAPETDELREKFRIVKARPWDPCCCQHCIHFAQPQYDPSCSARTWPVTCAAPGLVPCKPSLAALRILRHSSLLQVLSSWTQTSAL
jgi:hypothetical protein